MNSSTTNATPHLQWTLSTTKNYIFQIFNFLTQIGQVLLLLLSKRGPSDLSFLLHCQPFNEPLSNPAWVYRLILEGFLVENTAIFLPHTHPRILKKSGKKELRQNLTLVVETAYPVRKRRPTYIKSAGYSTLMNISSQTSRQCRDAPDIPSASAGNSCLMSWVASSPYLLRRRMW